MKLTPFLRFKEFFDNWSLHKLSDVSSFLDGRRKPIKEIDRMQMQGIYPYYGASGIIDYIDKYLFDEEIILLGEDGENIISRNLPLAFKVSGKCWVNNHAHVIKANKGTDIDFLTIVLERQNYEKYNTGTAQPKLNQEVCKSLCFYLPTFPEQQKIASFLSAVDEKIRQLKRKKELLEQYKKGVMQQLFSGKLRFKDENGKEFPEWEEKRLGEVADVSKLAGYEFTKHVIYKNVGKVIALRGLNIKNRTLDLTDVKYIDESEFSKLSRSKLYVDDLMFTYIGTIGEVALIPENDRFYLAPNVSRIRVNKDWILPKFISQYFSNDEFKNGIITKYISSSSQPALTMENVRKFEMRLPSLPEQQKIASFLSSLDKKIELVSGQVEKAQEFKKGLLQQMFV